ncbi:MAG: hypothetical protein JNL73_20425 [Anaerolineales bacterium]|nr:hypothetical protein [Anaerolineales bacterium]
MTAHGRPVYRDRVDAGQILARLLLQPVDPATVVLGLPRGGVIVAAPVARACTLPLDVLVARKLTHPLQPELAIGAVGSGSVVVVDQGAARHFGLTRAQIDILVARATAEVEARLAFYRAATGREPLALQGRPVIVIDDGIATGATVQAALLALKQHAPARITLAVPVCAADVVEPLSALIDEWVCPLVPADFHAVGAWYEDFDQVSDDEVVALLKREEGGGTRER